MYVTVTNTTTFTYTSCTLGTTESPTLGPVYTITTYDSYQSVLLVRPAVQAYVHEPARGCESYLTCKADVEPNPDISGIGVLAAFMTTAYLVLGLIIWAYCTPRPTTEKPRNLRDSIVRYRAGVCTSASSPGTDAFSFRAHCRL
ncbi:UDP-glucosyl transferase family protein [Apiospora sp. TS-2023a]